MGRDVHHRVAGGTLLLAAAAWMATAAPVWAQPTVEQLQALIEAQQRQIELQQQALEAQRQALQRLQADVATLRASTDAATATALEATTTAQQATETARRAETQATELAAAPPARPPATPASGQERVALTISGFVNQAMNVTHDGDSTDVFFVTNQNSTSRFRFDGVAQVTDDVRLGAALEIGVRPNSSNSVSQTNQDAGDSFDQRIVEAFVASASYGRLTLGKGSNASDGAAQSDLSGTTVAAFASIADIAGGMLFRDEASGDLTSLAVRRAFTDYDGGRADRLRYDTPRWNGFTGSLSVASNQRQDAAIRWSGQGETVRAAAAAFVRNPNEKDVDVVYGGSGSVLHTPTGLNLTLSAGNEIRSDGSNPYNLYAKAGYLQDWFSLGTTALSLDYTYSGNRAISLGTSDRANGHSVGLYGVQNISGYGTELYLGGRWYSVDPNQGRNLDDIFVFTTGTRVRF